MSFCLTAMGFRFRLELIVVAYGWRPVHGLGMSKKKPTETQRACLAVIGKWQRITGRSPSTADVALELGINRSSARRLMLACRDGGWMTAPRAVIKGEWALTPAGKEEIGG